MSYTIISTSIVSNAAPAVQASADEFLIVAANVDVIGNNGYDAIELPGTVAGGAITVNGFVAGFDGIAFVYNTGDEAISVGSGGSVIGQDDAVYLKANDIGYAESVKNAGYVFGQVNGVVLYNASATVENSGTIGGDDDAVLLSGNGASVTNEVGGVISGATALKATGNFATLVNAGSLSGTNEPVVDFTGLGSTVTNSGDIQGQNTGLLFGNGNSNVRNSGTISVLGDAAIEFLGGGDYVDNSGTITAGYNGVYFAGAGGATDWVVNEIGGVMDVQPTAGTNVIYDGDDALHVLNYGQMTGTVYSGGGNFSAFVNTGDFAGQLSINGGAALVSNLGKMTFDGTQVIAAAQRAGTTTVNGYSVYIAGSSGYDDRLLNAAGAVIDANGAIAVVHSNAGTFSFINHGDIYGDIDTYAQSTGANFSLIGGDVNFYDDASLFINRGELDGNLTFSGTGNIYRGQSGEVTGTIYGAGADGRYMGGDGDDTFDMTASGAKYVSGGAGDDTFLFTAAGLTAATTVLGGDGTDALDFTTGGTIAASAFAHVSQIETINLAAPTHLTLTDPLVSSAAGAAMTVNGSTGADSITATGLSSADTLTIYGGAGLDAMTVGAEKDVFRYAAATDSTGPTYDTITGVNYAIDRFDVSATAGTILGVNAAVTTGSLSTSTFNSDLTADLPAAKLGAHEAVLFTASAGTLSGSTFLVIDRNGVAGYQANADLVIKVVSTTGTLTAADFI